MASNVIQFPVRAAKPVYTAPMPAEFMSDLEEARYRVSSIRAKRDHYRPVSREWQVQNIILDWWENELTRLLGPDAGNVIELRRA